MSIEEAKDKLRTAMKYELRDHVFGDVEMHWENAEKQEIAWGYFGGGHADVVVLGIGEFKGDDAYELRKVFGTEVSSRNDETGPDDFVVGRTMPGLTLEGVRKELTGE